MEEKKLALDDGGQISGATMKKLVCDRCGRELTQKDDVDLAFEGKNSWAESVKAMGGKARGVFPCEHIIRCSGQMIVVNDSLIARCFQGLKKFF